MRIDRSIVKLLLVASLLVLIGLAIFPDRSPDEVAALVGIPLTVYLVLPLFISHLFPLPKRQSPGLRQIFARASSVERVILFLLLLGVTSTFAGIIMSVSVLAHALVTSLWGQGISKVLAVLFLTIGGGTIGFIMGTLYVLRTIVKGIRIYRDWTLAQRVVQRSAEWLVSSASRYARAA